MPSKELPLPNYTFDPVEISIIPVLSMEKDEDKSLIAAGITSARSLFRSLLFSEEDEGKYNFFRQPVSLLTDFAWGDLNPDEICEGKNSTW